MKKGFTLVEILSIIVVLGIITVIVFPSINGNINSKKEHELDKILGIVENAAKAYHTNNKNEYKISLDTLKKENYITNDLKDPTTGELLTGCVRVIKNDKKLEYKYGSCDNIFVKLNVELNGGTTSQEFNESYAEYDLIPLETPTKEGYMFKGWNVVKGNSILSNNTLVIGTTETSIYAMWETFSQITLDLNGGTISKNKSGVYMTNSTIDLGTPKKKLSGFIGWEIVSGDGILSGNTYTVGVENTTIKAIYNDAVYLNNFISDKVGTDGILRKTVTFEDKTFDVGIRYTGTDPFNYVLFNCDDTDNTSTCERWRIIGVFDVENENGNIEKRVKIINTSSTFKSSWDSSESEVNTGYGINQWFPSIHEDGTTYLGSDMYQLLNGYYIGESNTCNYCTYLNCSIEKQEAPLDNLETCTGKLENYNMKSLTSSAKSLISKAKWYTFGVNYNDDNYEKYSNANEAYLQEMGISTEYTGKECSSGQYCTDTVVRTTTGYALVGLSGISDIEYADGWMINNNSYMWTITPNVSSKLADAVITTCSLNYFPCSVVAATSKYIYPSVYLNANAMKATGDGTYDNPYTLYYE